ncbi:hypothetical protein, conserved [Eimeria tenella]|uniref:RNAse P Rpr2/Rpp21 subunit domain-containing protein n=1 Tax=Eimeria tenella TaxID=5802 RepID=U6KMZ6_EIMTE|nr:hypothetical protein, conserved [Eimeria tenella]CDJ39361.1 hypothetical protein, conserved [Eimeria tenella]|eukprot:XP_013230116.1 hypothetical protein, conserved [Eimeria tenella]
MASLIAAALALRAAAGRTGTGPLAATHGHSSTEQTEKQLPQQQQQQPQPQARQRPRHQRGEQEHQGQSKKKRRRLNQQQQEKSQQQSQLQKEQQQRKQHQQHHKQKQQQEQKYRQKQQHPQQQALQQEAVDTAAAHGLKRSAGYGDSGKRKKRKGRGAPRAEGAVSGTPADVEHAQNVHAVARVQQQQQNSHIDRDQLQVAEEQPLVQQRIPQQDQLAPPRQQGPSLSPQQQHGPELVEHKQPIHRTSLQAESQEQQQVVKQQCLQQVPPPDKCQAEGQQLQRQQQHGHNDTLRKAQSSGEQHPIPRALDPSRGLCIVQQQQLQQQRGPQQQGQQQKQQRIEQQQNFQAQLCSRALFTPQQTESLQQGLLVFQQEAAAAPTPAAAAAARGKATVLLLGASARRLAAVAPRLAAAFSRRAADVAQHYGIEVDPKAKQGLCAGCGVPLVPFLTSCIFTRSLPRGSFRRRMNQCTKEHLMLQLQATVPGGQVPPYAAEAVRPLAVSSSMVAVCKLCGHKAQTPIGQLRNKGKAQQQQQHLKQTLQQLQLDSAARGSNFNRQKKPREERSASRFFDQHQQRQQHQQHQTMQQLMHGQCLEEQHELLEDQALRQQQQPQRIEHNQCQQQRYRSEQFHYASQQQLRQSREQQARPLVHQLTQKQLPEQQLPEEQQQKQHLSGEQQQCRPSVRHDAFSKPGACEARSNTLCVVECTVMHAATREPRRIALDEGSRENKESSGGPLPQPSQYSALSGTRSSQDITKKEKKDGVLGVASTVSKAGEGGRVTSVYEVLADLDF